MKVLVNGRPLDLEQGATLRGVLAALGIQDHRGIAIALDEQVVPRDSWEMTELSDGQRVEVLRAVQGG